MAAADGLPVTSPVGAFRHAPVKAAAYMYVAAIAAGDQKKPGLERVDEGGKSGAEYDSADDRHHRRRYHQDENEDEDEDEGVMGGMEDL